MLRVTLAAFAICLLPVAAVAQSKMEPGPKTPEDSLKCFVPRPGFTVELMAAEPLVHDPIAFAWGPDGKFWVVEMGDYPLGIDGKGKFGGKVKFLEKTKKGEGPYDKATVFLDNLGYPTGVTPWGKGVLVTCAPDIFYAEDTKGTGKADKIVVLYTGFNEGNQQHRVNGLVWGLDGWLYGANGDSGGKVKSLKTGTVVDISGRDFRIKPDEGLIEAVTGQTQFGRCRDDWGNWFGNNNTNPMYHFVLEDRYLKRNPYLLPPDPRVNVSEKPGAARVYPISKPLPRFNSPEGLNHFTSACSAIIYRDDLFGPEFVGNSFVSEPVHNLIHREIVTPKGVTFTSKRAKDEQESEFLASTDNWFRPTMIQTGPDGALWIADMYRYVIEHPQWIPKEWQAKLDLRAGHDKGRIWRVYPKDKKPRPLVKLNQLAAKQLVDALESPSGWQRDMAQYLLMRSHDKKANILLNQMAVWKILPDKDDAASPLARLHAYWILEANKQFPTLAFDALVDRHPELRRHGIRMLEFRLKEDPDLADQLLGKWGLKEKDPHVRLQLAYTLGQVNTPKSAKLLARLSLVDAEDHYHQAAILSSISQETWEPFLEGLQQAYVNRPVPPTLATNLFILANRYTQPRGIALALGILTNTRKNQTRSQQFEMVANLMDNIEPGKNALAQLAQLDDPGIKTALKRINGIVEQARKTVADPKGERAEQIAAIRLLGRGVDRQEEDLKILAEMLSPLTPADLRVPAVLALGRLAYPKTPELLLQSWKSYSPELRVQVVDVLLAKADGMQAALAALEGKKILPFEIDATRRQRLLDHKDAAIRKRAVKIFAGAVNADRAKVVASYRAALTAKGDAVQGAKVFTKNCAACHQLGGIGQQVGPDFASIGDKSPEGLLIAILDPNRAVEARYVNYTAITKAGVTHSGLLQSETSTSITLVGIDGKKQAILRADLDELFSSGKSVMPEGLEKEISLEAMADLIAFLRSNLAPMLKRKTNPTDQEN